MQYKQDHFADPSHIVFSFEQLMALYSALADAHNALLNQTDVMQVVRAQVSLSAALAALEVATNQVSTH